MIAIVLSILVGLVADAVADDWPYDGSYSGLEHLSDFANWPGKTGPVIGVVGLSDGMVPVMPGCTLADPISGPDRYGIASTLVGYDFKWQLGETIITGREDWTEDQVKVLVKIAETRLPAQKHVMERFYHVTSPAVIRPDEPIVAGDVSFQRGRTFIRGNIVVELRPFGAMNERMTDVAKHIDAFFLTQPTGASAQGFRPVIERLEAIESPGTQGAAEIIVEASDPYGGTLVYEWGGADVNEVGDRYYLPARYRELGPVVVTLLIINPMGYYTTATIEGSVEEGFVSSPVQATSWGEVKAHVP